MVIQAYRTKMPREVEAMKVFGGLSLAALAYFGKGHGKYVMLLSVTRLYRALDDSFKSIELRYVEIAATIAFLISAFKNTPRATAALYTLSVAKIAGDYFFKEDPMIANVFELVGGDRKVRGLPRIVFDPAKSLFENVSQAQNIARIGWSIADTADGRRVFFHKFIPRHYMLEITSVTAYVEKLSYAELPHDRPNVTNARNLVISILFAFLNMDRNDFQRVLEYQSDNKASWLTVSGRTDYR